MAQTEAKTELASNILKQVCNTFLLGADPEFFVVNPPQAHVPNAGAYAANFRITAGEVGSDHGGRVWELRPAPSPSAYGVLTNIWKLLKSQQLAPVEQFRWRSGAAHAGDTIGGHIHFGLPNLSFGQTAAFDKITAGLTALDVIPAEQRDRLARHPEYVDWDKLRQCNGHMEYRSAASWLDKPGQALLCLTAYKLAAVDPDSVTWPSAAQAKARLKDWLQWAAQKDVDAHLMHRLLEKRNWASVTADPGSDFKPLWRKEELWHSD